MNHKPESMDHRRSSVIIKAASKNTTDLFDTLTRCPELLSRCQRFALEYRNQLGVPAAQIASAQFWNDRSESLPVRLCWLVIRHFLFLFNDERCHPLSGAPNRNRFEGCIQAGHFDKGRVAGCPSEACSVSEISTLIVMP